MVCCIYYFHIIITVMDRTEIDVGPLHVPLVKDESKGHHEGSSIVKKEKVKIRFFGESFILRYLYLVLCMS